ncbi:MAG: hypothetical protein EOP73_25465, partial [Variovorax sp.]
AIRTPDAVAVTLGDASLRYGELDARADRLATRLRALGVGRRVRHSAARRRPGSRPPRRACGWPAPRPSRGPGRRPAAWPPRPPGSPAWR